MRGLHCPTACIRITTKAPPAKCSFRATSLMLMATSGHFRIDKASSLQILLTRMTYQVIIFQCGFIPFKLCVLIVGFVLLFFSSEPQFALYGTKPLTTAQRSSL